MHYSDACAQAKLSYVVLMHYSELVHKLILCSYNEES